MFIISATLELVQSVQGAIMFKEVWFSSHQLTASTINTYLRPSSTLESSINTGVIN